MQKPRPYIEVATKPQPICLIGDLDGKFSNLEKHFRALGVIPKIGISSFFKGNQEPVWTGKNTKIINLGDRFADRHMEGFKITEFEHKLRNEAEKHGGDIIGTAGNHDDRMIGFLMGRWGEFITDDLRGQLDQSTGRRDYIGIDELLRFGNSRTEILNNMRNDPIGRMLLDEICRMKLFIRIGNALLFHTPPSKRMLDILYKRYQDTGKNLDNVVESINSIWGGALREGFFDPKREQWDNSKRNYLLLSNAFLSPFNGTKSSIMKKIPGNKARIEKYSDNITPEKHPFYTVLKNECGIDTIYHGHTDDVPKVDEIKFIGINRRAMYMPPETSTHTLRHSTGGRIETTLRYDSTS